METQVSTPDNDPSNQARDSSDVDEPGEHYSRAASQAHIHQWQENHSQTDGIIWGSETVTSLEELGCVSVLAKTVQGA